MKFILRNNLDKKEYVIDNIIDKSDLNLFYHFSITLPEDIIDGEYTAILMDGDEIKSETLCQVGDYKSEKTVYKENNTKTYTQYNGR